MLKLTTNPLKVSASLLKTSVASLAAILAVVASSASAQSLNDDLKPKKNEVRKVRTTKAPSKKSNNVKKSPPKPTNGNKIKKTTPNRPVSAQNPAPVNVPVVNPETPAQIIARYMDFQRSSSVIYKDWESVISQTAQTLQANPSDASAKAQMLIAQGELAFNRNDYSNALIHFNAAAQVLPNSSLPAYGIGKVYLVTKQPVEAENSFEKSIKLNKMFALAYKGMGDALTAQGKTKKAKEYYENAAKIGLTNSPLVTGAAQPNSLQNTTPGSTMGAAALVPVAQPSVQPSIYETALKEARALTAKKKWQDSLDKLNALAPSYPTADLYIAIGENYIGLEQMLSAQQAFRKATEINPNSALAFYKTGMVLFEMNEYKSAAESFEKSLILDQRGTAINRREARLMADRANERLKSANGKKRFLKII